MSRLNFVAIAMKMTSANKTKHKVAKINTPSKLPKHQVCFYERPKNRHHHCGCPVNDVLRRISFYVRHWALIAIAQHARNN